MNEVIISKSNRKLPEFKYDNPDIQPNEFLCQKLKSEINIEPTWLHMTYSGMHVENKILRIYYKTFFPFQFSKFINDNYELIDQIQTFPDYDQYAIMMR